MSKQEECPTTSTGVGPLTFQRLPTFKAPRDLSLGGVKLSKKVFTPNLNVTRNKNKGVYLNGSKRKSTEEPKKDDKKKERKYDKAKHVKNGQNVIKCNGIFSEGLGSIERHSKRASYGRDAPSTKTTAQVQARPTRNTDFGRHINDINGGVGSFSENKVEFIDDFKRVTSLDAPINLPMDIDCKSSPLPPKPPVKFKRETCVKSKDRPVEANGPTTVEPDSNDKGQAGKLFRQDKSTLILFKMPSSLPGRVGVTDNEPRNTAGPSTPPTANNHVDEKQAEGTRCTLKQMGEGNIGKIRIHRSGRVTLALGDSIMDVNASTQIPCYQQLVSVATDDETKTANMINMGQMKHKVTVTPRWEPILQGARHQVM